MPKYSHSAAMRRSCIFPQGASFHLAVHIMPSHKSQGYRLGDPFADDDAYG